MAADKLRSKIAEQEEMLRDMTFHFETQLKIAREGGEEGGGDVLGAAASPQSGKGKRKAKGRR